MRTRIWELRVADIVEAIEIVLEYTAGMTFDQFVSDRKTVDAVIRNFITIGEAASHLPEDLIEAYPSFPWREMRDMRNLVVHEYFGVDKLVVWETLQKNLPPILPRLKQLIDSSGK